MVGVVQLLTLLAVAVTIALALAHALELPGKMRLSKEAYYALQPIYYPGFTFAGFAEPFGILFNDPPAIRDSIGGRGFLAYLGGVSWTHRCAGAVYWLFTHPINKFWLPDGKLSRPVPASSPSRPTPQSPGRSAGRSYAIAGNIPMWRERYLLSRVSAL
jgi:hypothetical protein